MLSVTVLIQAIFIGYRLGVDLPHDRAHSRTHLDHYLQSLEPIFIATLRSKDTVISQQVLNSLEGHPEIRAAWLLEASGDAIAAWVSNSLADIERYTAKDWPIYFEGQKIGVLKLELDWVSFDRRLLAKTKPLLYLSALVGAATFILIYLLVRQFLAKPVEQLSQEIARFNIHDLDKDDINELRQSTGDNELSRLRDNLGDILDALRESMEARQVAMSGLQHLAGSLERQVNKRTEDLIAAKENAEQADRSKTEFLSVMTHELRTPLNAILGFADLLKKHEMDARNAAIMDSITLSARQLLSLVSDMIDYVALDTQGLAQELFSPVDAIATAISLQKKAADEKGLEINQNVDVHLVVTGDGPRLAMCMRQLISNAVKFTQQGQIDIDCYQDDAYMYIQVSDTGIGLTEEQHNELVKPFVQGDMGTTRVTGGIGLGLAIVKRVCDIWHGSLSFAPNYPQGTIVTLRLPKTGP